MRGWTVTIGETSFILDFLYILAKTNKQDETIEASYKEPSGVTESS